MPFWLRKITFSAPAQVAMKGEIAGAAAVEGSALVSADAIAVRLRLIVLYF